MSFLSRASLLPFMRYTSLLLHCRLLTWECGRLCKDAALLATDAITLHKCLHTCRGTRRIKYLEENVAAFQVSIDTAAAWLQLRSDQHTAAGCAASRTCCQQQ